MGIFVKTVWFTILLDRKSLKIKGLVRIIIVMLNRCRVALAGMESPSLRKLAVNTLNPSSFYVH